MRYEGEVLLRMQPKTAGLVGPEAPHSRASAAGCSQPAVVV